MYAAKAQVLLKYAAKNVQQFKTNWLCQRNGNSKFNKQSCASASLSFS